MFGRSSETISGVRQGIKSKYLDLSSHLRNTVGMKRAAVLIGGTPRGLAQCRHFASIAGVKVASEEDDPHRALAKSKLCVVPNFGSLFDGSDPMDCYRKIEDNLGQGLEIVSAHGQSTSTDPGRLSLRSHAAQAAHWASREGQPSGLMGIFGRQHSGRQISALRRFGQLTGFSIETYQASSPSEILDMCSYLKGRALVLVSLRPFARFERCHELWNRALDSGHLALVEEGVMSWIDGGLELFQVHAIQQLPPPIAPLVLATARLFVDVGVVATASKLGVYRGSIYYRLRKLIAIFDAQPEISEVIFEERHGLKSGTIASLKAIKWRSKR